MMHSGVFIKKNIQLNQIITTSRAKSARAVFCTVFVIPPPFFSDHY
jgi:hypothetical protein